MVQHDIYESFRSESGLYRDFERDAINTDEEEKVFDNEDMWRVFKENL
jgi:hypothetical protein